MGGVVLLGQVFGRGARVWWSLSLAVCLMLLIEPSLVESISFQLSVAATGGVAGIGPWLKSRWGRADWLDLTTSFGALLATAPLIWFHFGRFSMISIISNSLILPLVPILMTLGGVMLMVGLFSATLAGVIAWPTYAAAHLIMLLVGFFGA
jgi:competence protein ComEC